MMSALLDQFGRAHSYLRISLTDRCNLRCRYCMPGGGVARRAREAILTLEEVERVARVCAGLGVHKIRLTGGEPLLRHNVEWLVHQLAQTPGVQTVALTTNGVLLRKMAGRLRSAGLHRLNVSLDTLRRDRFAAMTGQDLLPAVLDGIEAALAAGFVPLKLNVVVIGGYNDDELPDFVELARDRPLHVRFIEQMPFPGNGWQARQFVPCWQMRRVLGSRYRLLPLPADEGAAVQRFQVPGLVGEVGFIAPVSEPFCSGCGRLRLTADGAVRTCLFSAPGGSVRELLRSGAPDEVIAEAIRAILRTKPAGHPATAELAAAAGCSMAEIGG